ncbi:hypothetical protein EJ377_03150 [Chryseobacterium arthrosphaerae]|uniref:Uncharacterized protein n=1 Tax=Chryseobacterium arthrosphaerae TaxID=651561 RepID=A0A3S0VJ62_9FLAO|nr:hypothetical protein EJ377_03150 [Chryseobacterium arthrosphaerae]
MTILFFIRYKFEINIPCGIEVTTIHIVSSFTEVDIVDRFRMTSANQNIPVRGHEKQYSQAFRLH